MITILFLVFGLAVLAAGIYYLRKEKEDLESRNIYSIVSAVGAVIAVGTIIKIVMVGL